MRKTFGWTAAVALGCSSLGSASMVHAQPGMIGSYQPPMVSPLPQVSPFLNMIGSSAPAATYFGQVQPQIAAQGNFQQINQQLQFLGQGGLMQSANVLPPITTGLQTGHPVAYLNTGSYFPLFNRAGGAGRGGLGAGPLGAGQPFSNLGNQGFGNTGFGGQGFGATGFGANAFQNSPFPLNAASGNFPGGIGIVQPLNSGFPNSNTAPKAAP